MAAWNLGMSGPRIEPENGQRLQNFAAAFSPVDDLLAVPQNGDRIALYDARGVKPLVTFVPPRPLLLAALRFNGDGTKLAATGANQVIHLWDLPAARPESARPGLGITPRHLTLFSSRPQPWEKYETCLRISVSIN